MIKGRITLRLLSIIAVAFVAAAVSIILIANYQTKKIIDRSQTAVYSEKLDSILEMISRKYDRLQLTGMAEVYEEDFKESVLRALRQVHYKTSDQRIYPFITGADGSIVMHPEYPYGDKSLANTEYMRRALSLQTGDFQYIYKKKVRKWTVFKHFKKWDWIVGYAIPVDVKYADAIKLRNNLLLTMSVITLLALLTLSVIITRLTKPITDLKNISTDIAAGNLEKELDVRGKDEIGILADSFAHMRDSIREKIDNLAAANKKLRESEGKFRGLVESSSDWIWEVDSRGVYTYASPQVKDILGYKPEEIVGKTAFDLMPPEEAERIGGIFNELSGKSEPIVSLENTVLHKDGQRVVLETSGVPVLDADGNVTGYRGVDRDITERRKAEEDLWKSEEKYSFLVEHIPDVTWITDNKGNTSFISSNIENIYGYSPEEIYREGDRLWFGRIHPNDVEKVTEAFKGVFEMGSQLDVEYRIQRKDGNWIWLHDRSTGAYEKDGILYADGVFSDITERKQAKEELQESEERFREFVEGTDNLIVRVSNQRRFIYVNHASLKVYGIPPEECIGQSTISFIDPRDLDRTQHWFTECVRNQLDIATIENRQVSRTGTVRDMIWTVNFHYDTQGQMDHINAIGRDITERKQAENELRHLRNYLSNIINSMPSVLVGVDNDGKVTQWNKTAEQATGIAAADAQGKTLSDVFPQLNNEMDRVRESIVNRRVEHNPKLISKVNDETRYEDVTIYPLVSNGVEGAVIRVDDVTERVRIEEMMIQSEKMLSVGGLAAGMAHEINNPLGGIMQNAAVIARRLTEDIPANRSAAEECGTDTETIRAYMEKRGIPRMLELVRQSGRRAAGIVQNMLSFSRKSESAKTSEDLAELLDKTIELASSDYDLKKKYDFRLIEIVREYDPERPKVSCEVSTVQQVFLNLFKNAAEAMYEQSDKTGPSRLILRVRQDEDDKDIVRVEVEDNGPGMDESIRKRVFEPFFTTKPVGLGTGLGLSVSYFIIAEHHGGTMDVESSPGKGAKFIIRLPLERRRA